MTVLDGASLLLSLAGAVFFLGGTLGLLRFPDLFSRLHALTKADNLGLGFIVAGLTVRAESVPEAAKLVLIWLLALAASSSACYMLGRFAYRKMQLPDPKGTYPEPR